MTTSLTSLNVFCWGGGGDGIYLTSNQGKQLNNRLLMITEATAVANLDLHDTKRKMFCTPTLLKVETRGTRIDTYALHDIQWKHLHFVQMLE